jgi:hypothetical protein
VFAHLVTPTFGAFVASTPIVESATSVVAHDVRRARPTAIASVCCAVEEQLEGAAGRVAERDQLLLVLAAGRRRPGPGDVDVRDDIGRVERRERDRVRG